MKNFIKAMDLTGSEFYSSKTNSLDLAKQNSNRAFGEGGTYDDPAFRKSEYICMGMFS